MPTQLPMGFMLPDTDWEVPSRVPSLHRHETVAIDIETRDDGLANEIGPGWVYRTGHISGVALAAGDERYYLPVRHPETSNLPEDEVIRQLALIFKNCRCVFHKAIYDLGWLTEMWGLPFPDRVEDTLIMEFTLEEYHKVYGLDAVCRRRGVPGKDEAALVEAARAHGLDPKKEMWKLPARFVGKYAEQDAGATLSLDRMLMPKIDAQGCMEAYRLETDIIPMIIKMRKRGIKIDVDKIPDARRQLREKRDENLAQLTQKLQIGRDVTIADVSSPKFLEAIFREENIPVTKTEKGNPSFKTENIEKIDHWLPGLVVQSRKMHDAGEKFIGNYIEGFLHRGRIHSEVHSTKSDDGGARTTRLAYSTPPLQQMPSRVDWIKKIIRGLFLPDTGRIWGALDYSQQEYRLIVHFAFVCHILGADKAVQMYRENPDTDFHDLASELTRLPRRKAKDVNFAKAFGAGVEKFAIMTGMTLEEAKETMFTYDDLLPFVKGLADFCSRRAQSKGFIKLLDGARSRYEQWEPRWQKKGTYHAPCSREEALARAADPDHDWYGERLKRAKTHKAMNSLIQGSAARQTKLCMRECYREGILPLLQMHDELDFDFDCQDDAIRAEEIMRDTVKLEVPVLVDAEFGVNWGAAAANKDTGYGASWDEAWQLMKESA